MIKLFIFIGLSWTSSPSDSLGVETVNGKTFVIHKVDEKETLFSISRRYRTSVDAILQFNSGAGSGLEIGQILKVPYTPKTSVAAPAGGTVHTVAAKETLFSISKKYGVSTDEIKQWNNLTDNALSIGQTLVIKKKGTSTSPNTTPVSKTPDVITKKGTHTVAAQETLFSIAKQYGVTMQQIRDWNRLEGNELKIGQTLYVSQPEQGVTKKPDTLKTVAVKAPVTNTPPPVVNTPVVTQTPEKKDPPAEKTSEPVTSVQPIRISESVKNGSENIETGLAELIEGTESNRKYLALHRTAPIGTILKVKNEMNNREVFVRVMGKLPDTALTDKLIIRISKSAYDRLGAIDPRFRVEVTYYK
jgi:LysM repeat protein